MVLLVAPALLGLGGCAGATPPSASPSSSSPSSSSAAGFTSTDTAPSVQGPTHEVELIEGRLEPGPSTVDLPTGESLTLVLTSDVAVTVHAHGFEVDLQVPAGSTTEIPLRTAVPGVYEVELHDPDLLVVNVAVR